MWDSYQALKLYHRRPSDDLALTDSIAAWCVDGCVLWFGLTVENALTERVNKGTRKEPRMEPMYTLHQLLDPAFRLPRPAPTPKVQPQPQQGGFSAFLAMAQQQGSGVKMYKYVGPPN